MSKKQLALLLIALVLLGLYAYYLTDWFESERIQIAHTLRPPSPARRARAPQPNPEVNSVSFVFDRKFPLTEVKVIPIADLETNKFAHPIWHLISESNSVPTKTLTYGYSVRGMRPKVKGAHPEPLQADVPYRLFVTAGKLTGEHDFKTTAKK